MAEMTVADLKSEIAGVLRGALQDIALQSVDRAEHATRTSPTGGSDAVEQVRQQLAGGAPTPILPYGLRNDPLKGAGLGFVRMIKAQFAATVEKTTPERIAESWTRQGHTQYASVPEALKGQRDFAEKQRGMSEGAFAAGGSLLYPEQGEFIELLYPQTLAYQLGARDMEFVKAQEMGKLNSGTTVSYVGEAANIVPSTPGTGVAKLTSKVAAGLVGLTNALLRNPSISADILVRDELLMRMALRRDLTFYRGTGTEFQPKGMTNWMKSTNKIAQTGTTLATKVTDLLGVLSAVDSQDVNTTAAAFAMNPRAKWGLASTLDGQGKFVFADMLARGELFGFRVGTTTQIPTNLGGGTNETEIYFGAHGDAILGRDSATPLAVELFPNGAFYDGSSVVSGISTDQSPIRIIEGHDVLLRHDVAFSMMTGVTWWI